MGFLMPITLWIWPMVLASQFGELHCYQRCPLDATVSPCRMSEWLVDFSRVYIIELVKVEMVKLIPAEVYLLHL